MNETWKEIEKIANECQKWWEMEFPLISLDLLKPLFDKAIDKERLRIARKQIDNFDADKEWWDETI